MKDLTELWGCTSADELRSEMAERLAIRNDLIKGRLYFHLSKDEQ